MYDRVDLQEVTAKVNHINLPPISPYESERLLKLLPKTVKRRELEILCKHPLQFS